VTATGLPDLDLDFVSGDLDLARLGEGLFPPEDLSCFPFSPVVTPSLSFVEIVVVEILFTIAGLSALAPLTGDLDLLFDLDLPLVPFLGGVLDLDLTGERDLDLLSGEAVLLPVLVLENFLSFLKRLSTFLFFWLGLLSFFILFISD